MRLIDADTFMEYLGLDTGVAREENLGVIVGTEDLDRQPTAYDVDKVVEQLEKLKRKSENHMDIILDDESSYPCEYNVADLAEQRIKAFETAIDIIKSGGIK